MTKRDLGTILWFAAGWAGGDILVVLTGAPAFSSLIPATVLAGLIRWDPLHLFWPSAQRRVRPIADVAAEIDLKAQREAQHDLERVSN